MVGGGWKVEGKSVPAPARGPAPQVPGSDRVPSPPGDSGVPGAGGMILERRISFARHSAARCRGATGGRRGPPKAAQIRYTRSPVSRGNSVAILDQVFARSRSSLDPCADMPCKYCEMGCCDDQCCTTQAAIEKAAIEQDVLEAENVPALGDVDGSQMECDNQRPSTAGWSGMQLAQAEFEGFGGMQLAQAEFEAPQQKGVVNPSTKKKRVGDAAGMPPSTLRDKLATAVAAAEKAAAEAAAAASAAATAAAVASAALTLAAALLKDINI